LNRIVQTYPERYQQALKEPGFIQDIAQKTARALPVTLITGATSLAAQVPVVLGNVAEVTVKKLGLGAGWQLLANFLGSSVASIAQHVGTASNIEKLAEKAKKEFYKEADAAAPKVTANVEPIVNTINNVEQQASEKTLDIYEKMQPELIDILNKLQMTKGKTSISALQSAKRKVNSMIESLSGLRNWFDPNAQMQKELYQQILGSIKQEMKNTAELHPEWGVPFYKAEQLHIATHGRGAIGKMIEKIAPGDLAALSPITKKLITGSFGSLPKLAKTAGWTLGTGLAAKEMMKFYNMYSKSPIIRQMIHGLTVDAMEHNIPSFMSNLKALDTEAQKLAAKPTYRIIKQGNATNQ
jgi:hypothetical protein